MPETESKYGYNVGQIVVTKLELIDENLNTIPAGTRIRIVAIAPKVRIRTGDEYLDSKQYFFNAVIESQELDYGNRIRANFCTIKKLPKNSHTKLTQN